MMIFAAGPARAEEDSFIFSPRAIILHVRTFRGNNGTVVRRSFRPELGSRPVGIIPGGFLERRSFVGKNKKP